MTGSLLTIELTIVHPQQKITLKRTQPFSRVWNATNDQTGELLATGPIKKLFWMFNPEIPINFIAQHIRLASECRFLPSVSVDEGKLYIGDELGCSPDDAIAIIKPLHLLASQPDAFQRRLLSMMILRHRLITSADHALGLSHEATDELCNAGFPTPWSISSQDLLEKGCMTLLTNRLDPIMQLCQIPVVLPGLSPEENQRATQSIGMILFMRISAILQCLTDEATASKLRLADRSSPPRSAVS